MAKSARASRIKKNNQNLKSRVFGPVEAARNERLSKKLLELAQQPKPQQAEMEVEQEEGAKDGEVEGKAEGTQLPGQVTPRIHTDCPRHVDTMEVDQAAAAKKTGNGFRFERNEKQKQAKAARIQKSTRQRKPRNTITFAKTGRAKSKKGSKR
jgi:hypothetical protein